MDLHKNQKLCHTGIYNKVTLVILMKAGVIIILFFSCFIVFRYLDFAYEVRVAKAGRTVALGDLCTLVLSTFLRLGCGPTFLMIVDFFIFFHLSLFYSIRCGLTHVQTLLGKLSG